MQTYLPGTEVLARGLRWEVVSAEMLGLQALYRLRGLEAGVLGQEFDLLSPFEPIRAVQHALAPERAAPLPNWLVYHQAFLLEQALGAEALLAVSPGRLRLEPYQLVPTLRALKMSRIRLLLADGVGLGKTIQAGLILTELLSRRLAHRILVVAPAGPLLQQWSDEMLDRFGLRLDIVDRTKLEEIRRAEELGANPFDRLGQAIASPEFLKQEHVLQQLERASYDVVILDEAHHYMDQGALGEREDTQRRRLAEVLAGRCDTLLLLTATPHDGNDRSFASLCELLDPSLVDAKGGLRGDRYRQNVIRRLKRHVPGRFRDRQVLPCPVAAREGAHSQFIALQRGLLALVAPQLKRAFRERRYSEVLAFIALLKRSVSTATACGRTLQVVADRYHAALMKGTEEQDARRQRLRSLRDYQRRLERFGAASVEEELENAQMEAEDLGQRLADVQREVRSGSTRLAHAANVNEALEELIALASAAETADPKLDRLVEEIRAIRQAEPNASVLIYTEYVDSQVAVVAALQRAGLGETLVIRGGRGASEDGLEQVDRRLVTDRFQSEEGLILVSTDAAAEGLNLHQHCHHLIHLELPFNPNRLEQRNGRIDRYGQTLDPIVRYLYLQGTFEERILFRLIAKFERQRSRLTFMPNTLGLTTSTDAAAERLLRPLMEEEERLFQDQGALFTLEEAADTQEEDPQTRQLLAEIDRSLEGFEKAALAASWLGEAGLNAEAHLTEEADQARSAGERVGAVDLLAFLRDAVRLDGGSWRQIEDDVYELALPPAWTHGLEHFPGFDREARLLRVTTALNRLRDWQNRPVGYVGRAHPVVRRALDRVRNISSGSAAGDRQDPRVSAVSAPVAQPELLCTFLGRIHNGVGRALERLFAVRFDENANYTLFLIAKEWIALADTRRAVRTTGLWERHFAGWGETALELAQAEALERFLPVAREFLAAQQEMLGRERDELNGWIAARAAEISAQVPLPDGQRDLFAEGAPSETGRWRSISDPAQRLAGLHEEGSIPVRLRADSKTALESYRRRLTDIEARLRFTAPEIVPLGLLMLIPEANHAA